MQEEFNGFDLQMRSMLEDAEAKPSKRVWKGISARLDAAAARSGSQYGWMRWAGAALAFAAALGAGFFFAGTQSSDVQPQEVSLVAQAVRTGEPAEASARVVETEEIVEYAEAGGPQSIAGPRRTAVLQASGDNDTAAVADNDNADAATAAPASATVSPTVLDEAVAATSERAGEGGRPGRDSYPQRDNLTVEEDGFAILAAEDTRRARAARRTALYLKGAVGGNDSDFRVSRPYSSMSPGYGVSGISELSTSTYGVPLTVGLGVRFYLIGGLSIGTGIDYSLLTRTFTGKYTEYAAGGEVVRSEAGNVSHSLQYIGIPVGLYYDVLSFDKLKFYIYGLGEAEYCISNKYTLYASPDIRCGDKVEKLQYSIGAGLGLEIGLGRSLGLYLDPGLRYYFPCDQPKSVRTDKPVSFSFDAGLRFKF